MIHIIKLFFLLFEIIGNAMKDKRRNEIKKQPLSSFDRKFGSLRDGEPVPEASDKQNSTRVTSHSE